MSLYHSISLLLLVFAVVSSATTNRSENSSSDSRTNISKLMLKLLHEYQQFDYCISEYVNMSVSNHRELINAIQSFVDNDNENVVASKRVTNLKSVIAILVSSFRELSMKMKINSYVFLPGSILLQQKVGVHFEIKSFSPVLWNKYFGYVKSSIHAITKFHSMSIKSILDEHQAMSNIDLVSQNFIDCSTSMSQLRHLYEDSKPSIEVTATLLNWSRKKEIFQALVDASCSFKQNNCAGIKKIHAAISFHFISMVKLTSENFGKIETLHENTKDIIMTNQEILLSGFELQSLQIDLGNNDFEVKVKHLLNKFSLAFKNLFIQCKEKFDRMANGTNSEIYRCFYSINSILFAQGCFADLMISIDLLYKPKSESLTVRFQSWMQYSEKLLKKMNTFSIFFNLASRAEAVSVCTPSILNRDNSNHFAICASASRLLIQQTSILSKALDQVAAVQNDRGPQLLHTKAIYLKIALESFKPIVAEIFSKIVHHLQKSECEISLKQKFKENLPLFLKLYQNILETYSSQLLDTTVVKPESENTHALLRYLIEACEKSSPLLINIENLLKGKHVLEFQWDSVFGEFSEIQQVFENVQQHLTSNSL